MNRGEMQGHYAMKASAQTEIPIQSGSQVTLHFSLALASGEVIDSNFEREPASFRIGDGNMLPGFEAELLGLVAGDRLAVTLPPERAFGAPNPGNLQRLARNRFPLFLDDEWQELQAGSVVSFRDAGGFDLPGVVREKAPDAVVVDFNHPLAGRPILFTALIVGVLPVESRPLRIRV